MSARPPPWVQGPWEAAVKRSRVMLVVGILVLGLVGAAPDSLGAPPRSAPATDADLGPTVYVGQLTPAQVTSLGSLGLDREDLTAHRTGTKSWSAS